MSAAAVSFKDHGKHVLLGNGFVELTISKPGGIIMGIKFGGIDNLLETRNVSSNRGYWDMNWSLPEDHDNFNQLTGTKFNVVLNSEDRVELSFYRVYDPDDIGAPVNVDHRIALLRGSSGFYSYAIFHRPTGWKGFNFNQCRLVFKLSQQYFDFMAIGDTKQRLMPYPQDRSPENSEKLAYPEAVILVNPINPDLKGEVDDKYQYSAENRNIKLHGWISTNPLVGFWIITPSYEFKNGGPLKQNLLCHTGPTCLSVFHSAHYAGLPLCARFSNGEAWTKVLGPVFVYLNAAASNVRQEYLWEDAKRQMQVEVNAWPYDWPASPSFALAAERGSVSGTLHVEDRCVSSELYPASFAWLGLALSGDPGSWQRESKGYQFWTQTDAYGNFNISNIVSGTYDLFGWVPGVIGDYKKQGESVTITPGSSFELGPLVYEAPRNGPTIWEIGVPERSAAGFFIPDPNPKYINKLFLNQERFRQYGLWDRYSEIYTSGDLVYTIGVSNWTKDWFFMQTSRVEIDSSGRHYLPTTWEIKFKLQDVAESGSYTLRIALAASNGETIHVRANSSSTIFSADTHGRDNAIARHGLHGLYSLFSAQIDAGLLKVGMNSFYITQKYAFSSFTGVMYDYLRLEAPSE